jgi:predicted nuclease with RNAse H fold
MAIAWAARRDLARIGPRRATQAGDWTRTPAAVEVITASATDALLLKLMGEDDKVGIDVPLGWPDEFVEFVAAHRDGTKLPTCDRSVLRLRETDRFVNARTRQWPLSMSADRIAIPAMRAATLLAALAERGEPVDRAGTGRVVDVYPAAALKVWGFAASGYKRKEGRARGKLLTDLAERTREWLDLSASVYAACETSDDVLDAVVAALVARAAAVGLCESIPVALHERARREGWIALPTPGSLARLARA